MRQVAFKAVGGPHDGDTIPMPVSTVPTSKSLVLQSDKHELGTLHRYFFNRLTYEAIYEGVVKVAPDRLGGA